MTRSRPRRARPAPIARGRRAGSVAGALMLAIAALALARLALVGHGMLNLPPAERAATGEARAAPGSPHAAWTPLPEPAAGPDSAAGRPTDAAARALQPGPAASPAVAGFDPAGFSASEVAVLHQLAARRAALEERARRLDLREALIETAAAGLEEQIARLDELQREIGAAVAQHDAAEEAKLTSLVKIYETMKPKAAAEIFDRLEMPVLIRVVERMRAAKSADVLARMDPLKARQVTTELARRTRLLQAGGAAASSKLRSGDG